MSKFFSVINMLIQRVYDVGDNIYSNFGMKCTYQNFNISITLYKDGGRKNGN